VAGPTALGASNISGTLTIAATDLSQSGPVSVAGNTTLNVVNDIALDDAGNDFTTVAVMVAQNVWLGDANDLTLGASAVSGMLSVTAGGSISQSGAIAVSGAVTLSAGPASDIALLDPANDLSSPDGVGIDSGRNVALRSSGPLTLNPSTVSGTLAVTAAGAITQTGEVTVAGKTTLAAGAGNDIILARNNNFRELAVTSGRDVTLANAGPMVLGTSSVAGSLTVNTAGGLTQNGPLTIAGTTALTATAGNITLNDADNNFCANASLTPAVAVVADTEPGQTVALRDKDTVVLGPSRISGTLGVTAGGNISQSGALAVTGATTLATSTSSDILLNLANGLSTVSVASGKDVTLTNAGAMILGTSSVSGMLRVTAGGLSQSGPVAVAGNTILNVASDITLPDAGNDFGAFTVTAARNVSLRDGNSVDLGGAVVSGDLRIEAGGAITDSGVVSVVRGTTLSAGDDILLDTAASAYQGVLSLAGHDVSVTNDRATVLGDCTVTGDLAVLADGSLTNLIEPGPPLVNGAITVLGQTVLNAGSNRLTLYLARCRFVGVIYVTGDPVDIIPP
jgi:hypothetical protein